MDSMEDFRIVDQCFYYPMETADSPARFPNPKVVSSNLAGGTAFSGTWSLSFFGIFGFQHFNELGSSGRESLVAALVSLGGNDGHRPPSVQINSNRSCVLVPAECEGFAQSETT